MDWVLWTPSGRPVPSSARMQTTGAGDRTLLMEHLASVTGRVDQGQQLIRRQMDRIYFLGQARRDTVLAELVLVRLESSQALRIAEREQLEHLLSARGGRSAFPDRSPGREE